jgi:hypothetical protein
MTNQAEQLAIPGTEPTGNEQLHAIIVLAQKMEELHEKAGVKSAELEAIVEEGKRIEEVVLPDLMRQLGLSEFTLTNGKKISLKTDYQAHVSKERWARAAAWLKEHRMDSIIKGELIISKEHESEIFNRGIPYQLKENIHPSTLKAFVKEQCEQPNSQFPREIFGVYETTRALIKE